MKPLGHLEGTEHHRFFPIRISSPSSSKSRITTGNNGGKFLFEVSLSFHQLRLFAAYSLLACSKGYDVFVRAFVNNIHRKFDERSILNTCVPIFLKPTGRYFSGLKKGLLMPDVTGDDWCMICVHRSLFTKELVLVGNRSPCFYHLSETEKVRPPIAAFRWNMLFRMSIFTPSFLRRSLTVWKRKRH